MRFRPLLKSLALAAVLAVPVAACSSSGSSDAGAESPAVDTATASLPTVSPEEAAATIAAGPDELMVLDVRTPEEFTEGHLAGAELIDFYEDDFEDRLAELDRSVPYVLYCRSGNRSGQTLSLMDQLGFTDVVEVGGGIQAWEAAGLPVER